MAGLGLVSGVLSSQRFLGGDVLDCSGALRASVLPTRHGDPLGVRIPGFSYIARAPIPIAAVSSVFTDEGVAALRKAHAVSARPFGVDDILDQYAWEEKEPHLRLELCLEPRDDACRRLDPPSWNPPPCRKTRFVISGLRRSLMLVPGEHPGTQVWSHAFEDDSLVYQLQHLHQGAERLIDLRLRNDKRWRQP